jgi:hypothetical protein
VTIWKVKERNGAEILPDVPPCVRGTALPLKNMRTKPVAAEERTGISDANDNNYDDDLQIVHCMVR